MLIQVADKKRTVYEILEKSGNSYTHKYSYHSIEKTLKKQEGNVSFEYPDSMVNELQLETSDLAKEIIRNIFN